MNASVVRHTALLGRLLFFVGAAALAADSCVAEAQECAEAPSWVFRRSTYSHAPETGARVAQYERHAPVEGLEDPRLYTSGYRRTRTTLRGADGSIDSSYQVQNWGNGRGGLDAEWERFHDAWLQSYTSGGTYQTYGAPYGQPFYGHGGYGGHGGGGYPGYGYPGPYGYGHGGGGPASGPYGPQGHPHGGGGPMWQPPQP